MEEKKGRERMSQREGTPTSDYSEGVKRIKNPSALNSRKQK